MCSNSSTTPEFKHADKLALIYKLVEGGMVESASDMLFDLFDDLHAEGKFEESNEIMCRIDLNKLDTNLVVALLCITHPAKDHLPDRPKIVYLAEARLKILALDRVKKLMDGLY